MISWCSPDEIARLLSNHLHTPFITLQNGRSAVNRPYNWHHWCQRSSRPWFPCCLAAGRRIPTVGTPRLQKEAPWTLRKAKKGLAEGLEGNPSSWKSTTWFSQSPQHQRYIQAKMCTPCSLNGLHIPINSLTRCARTRDGVGYGGYWKVIKVRVSRLFLWPLVPAFAKNLVFEPIFLTCWKEEVN